MNKINHFIKGMASILGSIGSTEIGNGSNATDEEAIRNDFDHVGSYLYWAACKEKARVKVEQSRQLQLNLGEKTDVENTIR